MRNKLMRVSALALVAALGVTAAVAPGSPVHALSWFAPWAVIDAGDARSLTGGEVIARTLPADGHQIGVFLAGAIGADPETFARRVRDSRALWRHEKVPQVVMFSAPPRADDVQALELDPEDLDALRDCRPGDCDLKLTAPEIAEMRQAIVQAGAEWRSHAQRLFRGQMLRRVRQYVAGGFASLDPYRDHDEPVDPQAIARSLLEGSPWLSERAPAVARALDRFPTESLPHTVSSIYWMKTTYLPKPTIQAVHVLVHRPVARRRDEPAVLVVSRQIFATHYVNGSLAVSVLVNAQEDPARWYLGYANRTHVDGLGGWFSGVRRFFVERRVRDRAREIFALQRDRIEGDRGAASLAIPPAAAEQPVAQGRAAAAVGDSTPSGAAYSSSGSGREVPPSWRK